MHSIDDSYEGLGGFVMFLDLGQDKALRDTTTVLGYEWSELKFLLTDDEYVSPYYPAFVREDFYKVVANETRDNTTLIQLMEAQAA